jgi:plastocyanin
MSALGRFLMAVLVLACCVAAGAAQHAPKPVVHRIVIDATSFSETSLTIRTGDTVEWLNKDVIPHTATATKKGGFDSGVIPAGQSWRHTFDKAGRLPYVCSFHPTMKATLRVR